MCPFGFVTSPSVQAALLIFHFLSTTSPLPLAVQTLNYSKDAEHSSSSPVSQIPLYNPQRNLLLCTRWIVFVAVFITGGGGALRFLRVVASNTGCWSYGGTWSEEVSVFLVFSLAWAEFYATQSHLKYLVSSLFVDYHSFCSTFIENTRAGQPCPLFYCPNNDLQRHLCHM